MVHDDIADLHRFNDLRRARRRRHQLSDRQVLRVPQFIFLGFISRDTVIAAATGWTFLLATVTFVQMFGITLFTAMSLGAVNITIKISKSA